MTQGRTPRHLRAIPLPRLLAGIFVCGLPLIIRVNVAMARTQDESVTSGPVATLRVETNIVQIPVLILDKSGQRLNFPIALDRVAIRVGQGAWVRPRYVRLEGEDPIDLAIVVDPRATQVDLLPKLSKAIAALSPSSLTSRDQVSIYVMGCSVMQVAKNIPVDADALREAADTVLGKWKNPDGEENHARCKAGAQLWDTLAYVAQAMSDKPGRRTILAITNGDDEKSKRTAEQVGSLARLDGVTIFALDTMSGRYGRTSGEQALSTMSGSSGGIVLSVAWESVDQALQRTIQMLRERYIVEFSRPYVEKSNSVHFDVRVTGSDLLIRAASKSVPLPDRAEAGAIDNSSLVPAAPSEDAPHSTQ